MADTRVRVDRLRKLRFLRVIAALSLLGSVVISTSSPSLANDEAEPIRSAVDVVFVLDNSGSMKENDPAFLARAAVEDFSEALASDPDIDGRVGIVLFDGGARVVRPLSPIGSDLDERRTRDALAELDFSGQRTNSPAGIERALYEFRQNGRENARRAIVLLTDGQIDTGNARADAEASRWLREDLAGESQSSDIRIFGVAFTDAADYQLMQAVAQRTQARYYRAFEAAELRPVVDDVLSTILADDGGTPLAEAEPVATDVSTASAPADVSAAPVDEAEDSRFTLLGLLPVALLFVAGALYVRSRRGPAAEKAVVPGAVREEETPLGQLLDLGGALGRPGAAIEIGRGRTRIGRDPHNEIMIEDDAISSEHALIEYAEGRYWIEDRRSTNGTSLGDQLLVPGQRVQLKGGDHVRLADVDLMFVLAGYVPGGRTVFLNPTTTPPGEAMAGGRVGSGSTDDESSQRGHTGDSPNAVSDAAPEASREASAQLSLLRPPVSPEEDDDDLAREVAPPAPSDSVGNVGNAEASSGLDPATLESRSIRANLDDHLARVRALSPAFAAFIERAFEAEIRDAIAVSARDLTREARETDHIVRKDYTFDGIRFVLCGVPGEVERARDLFVGTFGGFTRMLSEELHAESFRTERCEILAVLTFGFESTPWVSLSIVPDEGQDPRIDLLSYEFLTEDELHEIDLDEHTDLSQSGLG